MANPAPPTPSPTPAGKAGTSYPLSTDFVESVFALALLSLRVANERNLWPPGALAKTIDVLADQCGRACVPDEVFDALIGYTRRAAEAIWPGELEVA